MFYLYYLLIDNDDDCIKFDEIVKKYEYMIAKVTLYVTKDKFYAEEAAQSALVSIARNISRIETDNEAMLKSYIYTIAENAGIDALRRKCRDSKISNLDDYANIPAEDDLFNNIAGSEGVKRLAKQINKMPVYYRDVLVLYFLHEHPLCQIADELDRNYSTVRKQLTRGRKMLENLIKEENFDD